MPKQTGLNKTAESIGTGLGHLQTKYDAWMQQRSALASELHDYVTKAKEILTALGHTADVAIAETKAAVVNADVARKRTISEAHKKAISDAAKARAAARKAQSAELAVVIDGGPTKRNVSPDVRARLSVLAKSRWAKARKAGKTNLG
jgi:hypothetical protein